MSRILFLLLLIPAVARAGTSDPGGVAEAIIWLALFAVLVWIAISIFIGIKVARSPGVRIVVAIGLCTLPVIYIRHQNDQMKSNHESNSKYRRERNEALVSMANEYLTKRCAEDRVLRTLQPVDPAGGVLLRPPPEFYREHLDLPGTPPPEQELAHMHMHGKHKVYDKQELVAIHDAQYKQPIHWVREIVQASQHFDFVETIAKYAEGRPLVASARKQWWLGPGREAIAPSAKQDLNQRIALLSEGRNDELTLPVNTSTARYVFAAEDISTLEDRNHWVARGRLLLWSHQTGEIVAEYVGFAASLSPAFRPGERFAWDFVNVCPGRERDYQDARMDWRATRFFFREVVAYKAKLAK